MTLVELTRRWKDKKIDNKQAKELFKKIVGAIYSFKRKS